MTTELLDYADSLRREVTAPGSDLFSDVTNQDLVLYLADAFWEARLDGFLDGYTCDEDGTVNPTLPRDQIALVVLYAGIKVLRNRLINLSTSFRVSAGPVEYETQYAASVISEMLRQLRDLKDRYLEQQNVYTHVYLTDASTVRQISYGSYSGHFASVFAELTSGG